MSTIYVLIFMISGAVATIYLAIVILNPEQIISAFRLRGPLTQAAGRIVSAYDSEVIGFPPWNPPAARMPNSESPQRTTRRIITYEYLVGNITHKGTESLAGMHQYLPSYQTGQSVAVFYTPHNPSYSTLDPTRPKKWRAIAITLLIASAIAIWVLPHLF